VAAVGGFDGAEEQEPLLLHYDYFTAQPVRQAQSASMQQKVCHYKISKTESRPCVFNQLRTARLKKAQTWAIAFSYTGITKRLLISTSGEFIRAK
jgi:hypothetical protein